MLNFATNSRGSLGRSLILALLLVSLTQSRLFATPSQQEVFKSIQESMGPRTEVDSTPVLILAAGGVIALVVLSVLSRRQQKAGSPAALNNPKKLLKEVMREISLKPAEVKQLKLLADSVETQTGEAASPLMLLLCPSLMGKGLKASPGKIDRKVIAQMVRRLRLNQPIAKS
jgi:hypothetical protein